MPSCSSWRRATRGSSGALAPEPHGASTSSGSRPWTRAFRPVRTCTKGPQPRDHSIVSVRNALQAL
eukprot:10527617-Alexandrium_andersonii.AAC.1